MLNRIERSKDDRVSLVGRNFSKCFRFFPRLTTTTRDRSVGYKAEQRERQVELSAKWSSRGDGTTERSRRERHEWHMERWQLFASLSLSLSLYISLSFSFCLLFCRMSLLPYYPSGISPVELVSLSPQEDPSGPSSPIKNCLENNVTRDLTLVWFRTL